MTSLINLGKHVINFMASALCTGDPCIKHLPTRFSPIAPKKFFLFYFKKYRVAKKGGFSCDLRLSKKNRLDLVGIRWSIDTKTLNFIQFFRDEQNDIKKGCSDMLAIFRIFSLPSPTLSKMITLGEGGG